MKYSISLRSISAAITFLAISPVLAAGPSYSITGLGTLGGTLSNAYGINNSGQIVGDSVISNNNTSHAFLYSGGVMTDLGTLGGTFSTAVGINDNGQIVGRFKDDRRYSHTRLPPQRRHHDRPRNAGRQVKQCLRHQQ